MTIKTTFPSSTFTMDKRQYLHSKLDEVLRVWDRGTGKGSFIFIIKDGTPDFEFCSKLDFLDDSAAPEHPRHQPHHSNHSQFVPRRHRGPARRERDRQRAARHQAALAAKTAAVVPAASFPGEGKRVGNGTRPTLPIPLQKGDVFPPPQNFSTVCTTLSTTPSTTVATSLSSVSAPVTSTSPSILQPLTTPMVVSTMVPDADSGDVSDEDEPCGRCKKHFDGRSNPTGCPLCLNVYHSTCKPGHKCLSFVK